MLLARPASSPEFGVPLGPSSKDVDELFGGSDLSRAMGTGTAIVLAMSSSLLIGCAAPTVVDADRATAGPASAQSAEEKAAPSASPILGPHTEALLVPTVGDGGAIDASRVVPAIQARLRAMGYSKAQVHTEHATNIIVAFTVLVNDRVITQLAEPIRVEFRPVLSVAPNDKECEGVRSIQVSLSESAITACDAIASDSYRLSPAVLTYADVAGASFDHPGGDASPGVLTLRFEDAAKVALVTDRLSTLTTPKNQLAIVVDGQVLSAPAVQAVITGGEMVVSNSSEEAGLDLWRQVDPAVLGVEFSNLQFGTYDS